MTFQFVDSPLAEPVAPPAVRNLAWSASLDSAVFPGAAPARLAEPGALVVTTGQQPGLLTGPLYTIHKALSARALARALEHRWGRPVVPVFWVAGDDHDYAEAAVAHWLATDGSVVTAELPPRPPGAPLTPLYREPVPAATIEILDRLEQAIPPGESRDGVMDWLRRHYAPDRSLAAAFGGALAELFDGLGIVTLDASAPAVKAAAWPLLRNALERAPELDALLAERAAALAAEGHDAGVKVGDGASLIMLEGAGGRDRLLTAPAGAVARRTGDRFARAELDRLGAAEPERFSPNVLLRPVVEAALLPTVAYVAGPAELRYLRLAECLYRPLGVDRQLPVPRWSGLLLEPRVVRGLAKLDITVAELLDPAREVDARLARAHAPAGFDAVVHDLRGAIQAGYDRLAELVRAIDPTMEKPARSTAGSALGGLADLEKRVMHALKRKEGETLGQLDRVRTALQPLGKPQERVLGWPALAARYGTESLGELAGHVDAWYQNALEGPTSPA